MAEKPKRKKEPGRCIFCQGFGLSKEHIFADWLRDYIPRQMLEHKTRKAHVHPLKGTQASVERRTGDPHSRRIRCVCQTCNNEWMSRLQEQARPFLVPMLIGETTSLHRRSQTTLAAWITVMVMVSEFVDRDMVAVSQAERAFVHERQKAPNHWRIWIGAHERKKFPFIRTTSNSSSKRNPRKFGTLRRPRLTRRPRRYASARISSFTS